MPRRNLLFPFLLTFLTASIVAAPCHAQFLVVKLKSVDETLAAARYGANLIGGAKAVKELDSFLANFISKKGLPGVDQHKPFGLYVQWPGQGMPNRFQDFPFVGFIPITEKKVLLEFFDRVGFPFKKSQNDLMTVKLPDNLSVVMRFHDKYLYFSMNAKLLQGKLLDPELLQPRFGKTTVIAASLSPQMIPLKTRKLYLQAFLKGLRADGKGPGSDAAEFLWTSAVNLVEQTQEIRLDLDLDRKNHQLAIDFKIIPQAKSKLAAGFRFLGSGKSRLGALSLPDGINLRAYIPSLLSFQTQTKTAAFEELENVVDPKRRPIMRRVAKALVPLHTQGSLDLTICLRFVPKHFVFLAAVEFNNGHKLESLARDFVKDLPRAQRQRFDMKWASVRHRQVNIHRMTFPFGPGFLNVLGNLNVAFQEDLIVACLAGSPVEALTAKGKTEIGLTAIRDSLDILAKAPRKNAPLLEVSGAPLRFLSGAMLMTAVQQSGGLANAVQQIVSTGKLDPQLTKQFKDHPLVQLFLTLKNQKPEQFKFRLALTGGDSLRLRLDFDTKLLQLVAAYIKKITPIK